MKKLLVIVDYQNDFVDGTLGFDGAENLDEGIANLMAQYLESGDDIIMTYDTHDKEYLHSREGKSLPVEHCIKGTKGFELYGKVKETADKNKDKIIEIEKVSFGVSPKSMVELSEKIYPLDITIVGLVSNICVISNACVFQAAFPQANINVIKALTASFDNALNQKTLDVLEGLQVKVI